MSTIYKGVGCSWGVSGSSTAFGSMCIQSADYTKQGDEFDVICGDGNHKGWVGYNSSSLATFEYIAAGTGSLSGSGVALTSTPTWGQKITVTSAQPAQLAGTAWITKGVTVRSTNTSAAIVTVNVQNYPLIT